MQTLRAYGIIAVFLVVTLVFMPYQMLNVRFKRQAARTFPWRYHRFMAKLFGIRMTVIGKPVTDEGMLIVANHTSWLDIVIFSALTPLSFVAKSEVATWPFFSTLANLQRTVYVERQRRQATGEARDQIRDRLLAGDTLVLFPEGTSNDGNAVLPFKSALMGASEARVDDGKGGTRAVKVQPVSTAYVGLYGIPMGRENRPLYAWYGDMDLVPHLFEALLTGPLDVIVEFHSPMTVDDVGGRKALAAKAEAIVRRGQTRKLAGFQGPTPAEAPAAQPVVAPALAPALA
ncbi:MAG: 1-acyl-sn-glycerol-3-phosphate acyltransferase [Alphaproteobacteria bacterium]|nr:1-acyl-sn-glycerol-3-phosphate acyltransferase [Alphaproteobacteria bacterium]MBL7099502.1 1-acyl-sn-glycerol-3-phosphate acyltransferase [Alphaproteobacteria bacterium]